MQPFTSRRSIAHAVVASVLRNETILESAEDVKGVLELCHVLIKDQNDAGVGMPMHPGLVTRQYSGMSAGNANNRTGQRYDMEEMGEEQGCLARMVHLFRSPNLDSQLEVCSYNQNSGFN